MTFHETYMHRCIELAQMAAGFTAPNPLVGSVLVYNEKIIGEGYHRQYGQPHAEVNCICSVKEADRQFIPYSTLYVSLEPCAHFGKTPPCADLIVQERIPQVVIGCRDPFKQVDGKGFEKLQAAGVKVVTGVLEKECRQLNKRFFTFHVQQRPYIVLKWAQSSNGNIANRNLSRVLISNAFTNVLVHKWRSEEMGILAGTNTVLHDNPSLTVRHWKGPNPVRLVLDREGRIPPDYAIFNGEAPTIIFNTKKHSDNFSADSFKKEATLFYRLSSNDDGVKQIVQALFALNLQSVLVEGGATVLQSFIDEGLWDEARIITNTTLVIEDGLPAPVVRSAVKMKEQQLITDRIEYYEPK